MLFFNSIKIVLEESFEGIIDRILERTPGRILEEISVGFFTEILE